MKNLLKSSVFILIFLLGFYIGEQYPNTIELIRKIPIMDFTFENFGKLLGIWFCYLMLIAVLSRENSRLNLFSNTSFFGIIVSLTLGFGALLFATLYPFKLFKSFWFEVISFGPFLLLISIELFFSFFYSSKEDSSNGESLKLTKK